VTPQWWLLVAFLLLAGAMGLLAERLLRRRKEARAYLKGVRYVLSDDPDAAIAALSDAAQLGSPEAVETYLALGALFRRTGDLARAIRLHRNMLMRSGLDPARRIEVERELAHDYRRGGMLDEAVAAYRVLAAAGDRAAREGLRDVLVDLGRLAEAAEVQRLLSGPGEDPLLAHLLAAQARSEVGRDADAALAAALAAVAAAPRSADALLALAEAEGAASRGAEAREAVSAALDEAPGAALLAWPALAASGDPAAALALLDARLSAAPRDAALHYLRGRVLHLSGRHQEAMKALRQALELDVAGEVTLAMRDLLREAEAPAPEDLAPRHDLMVAALLRKARPVRCTRCGAEAPTRQWRCKRCGAFESFACPAAAGEPGTVSGSGLV
jgi:lipopolysaccharide biosynthesis regulator YciM